MTLTCSNCKSLEDQNTELYRRLSALNRTPEECIDILLQRMNISKLARAIGVDASAISHVRAGRYRITNYEAVDKLRNIIARGDT